MPNLLILGGAAEGKALAKAVAEAGLRATYSYAGRVALPEAQPLPTRMGGFGGVDGLVAYLREKRITHLVDATHPFAAQMSRHAVAAAEMAGVPLIALTRPPWEAGAGDDWRHVEDMEAAVAALEGRARRVFLAIGRMEIGRFAAQPQHHYLLRLVDPPETPLSLTDAQVIVARGPFDEESDRQLLQQHRIDLVVSKNSGGQGARAKIDAARALGLPVLMVDRPALPPRLEMGSVEEVLRWVVHSGT